MPSFLFFFFTLHLMCSGEFGHVWRNTGLCCLGHTLQNPHETFEKQACNLVRLGLIPNRQHHTPIFCGTLYIGVVQWCWFCNLSVASSLCHEWQGSFEAVWTIHTVYRWTTRELLGSLFWLGAPVTYWSTKCGSIRCWKYVTQLISWETPACHSADSTENSLFLLLRWPYCRQRDLRSLLQGLKLNVLCLLGEEESLQYDLNDTSVVTLWTAGLTTW